MMHSISARNASILFSLATLLLVLGLAPSAWAVAVVSEETAASETPQYPVYPTISLQDPETGKYLGATISNGKATLDDSYSDRNTFELLWNLQPSSTAEDSSSATSDTLFALQSRENRLYLGVDTGLRPHPFSFEDRFITPTSKLEIIDTEGYAVDAAALMEKLKHASNEPFRVRNTEDGVVRWLSFDGDKVLATGNPTEASYVSLILRDDNQYSDDELNILTSPEWFDQAENIGYWDIQDQIGAGKADLLRTLGYTVFTDSDKRDTIYLNPNIGVDFQCSVGVKKGFRGPKVIYEVVIAIQGTGGYGNLPVDIITNIGNHIDEATGLHTGYKAAADLFWRNAANIKGTVDNKTLSLAQLISEARYPKGNAHFTLLGHSMGGSVAQCFAHTLASCGVPKSEIRGRTFESALAVSRDDEAFTDWYNIVIDTDAVSNGTVPMSIRQQVGVHRLGKTITLYDPKPDADVEGLSADLAGIAIAKHDMTQAVRPLMKKFSTASDEQITEVYDEGTWVTAISNAQSNYRPYANSGELHPFPKAGTVVHPEGYKANKYGNRWYKLGEGGWMYEGNIMKISTYERAAGRYYVASKSAPMRAIYLQEGDVVTTLGQYTEVTVDACAWNDRGNKWYHASKAGGQTGWVYSEHLLPVDPRSITEKDAIRRMEIHCPVDVVVRDSQGKTVASIVGDSVAQSSDESRVIPEVNDDEKTIYLIGDGQYQVDIQATDYGSLDYSIAGAYDEDAGAWTDARAFEGVALDPDKLLASSVSPTQPIDDVRLQVVDPETRKPLAEVGQDGTEGTVDPATEPEADNTPAAAKTSISKAKVSGVGNAVYTGKAVKPSPTVKLGGKTLKAKRDYTVSYKTNKKVGAATVVVKGTGSYTGTVSKTFKILPKATSLKKATGAKKAVKATWKKVARQVDGYQIRVALDKKFEKGVKTIVVKKAKTTSVKVKKLKAGTRYYVQVRTYKQAGGKKYYSAWSKPKAAKTK